MTHDEDMLVTLVDRWLRFWSDRSGYSNDGLTLMLFPLSVPEPIENPEQPALPVPLAFPVIAPGGADLREAAVDISVIHHIHGHANEFLAKEIAKSLGVYLLGKLRPCTGCSIAKGYHKPIANSTKSRATEKLGKFSLTSVALRVLIRCLVRSTQ